ncbi:MAG: DUF6064 family protein [Acidobacteriota bacterium]|nr:DUF6064 family protein [Acidobacteriota bacterium]
MKLPFSESAFLDLFGLYNQALWPLVAGAWLVSLAVVIRAWRAPRTGGGVVVLLAAHWLWSAVAYHWEPYIKGRYESRDGWGSQSGFIERRMVPSRVPIEPVDPDYDSSEKSVGDDIGAGFRAAGFGTATNADGSVEFTREPGMSRQQGFEQLRNQYLAAQRRREELARNTRPR